MTTDASLYEVTDLRFRYANGHVLDGVSFSLVAGRFYGLLGPNGCGKTTLLDLLSGLKRPVSGHIRFKGRPLGAYSRKELAREIALVPQNFYINFPFTVRQVVMMGRYPHLPRFAPPGPDDRARVDAVLVSDYGKGVVTHETISVAIAEARKLGKMVCVDPKESHFASYVGVTAITPNQKDAGAAVGEAITDEDSLLRVGWELQNRLEADCVVITRGEHGMSLFMSGGELVHLPTVAREVFDVTGAGDTVVSALAVALAAGGSGAESEKAPTWTNGPPADPGYFPVAVWLQSPRNAAKYKAAGINLYIGLFRGPTEEELQTLRQVGATCGRV